MAAAANGQPPRQAQLEELLEALQAQRDGDFSHRLPSRRGILGEVASAFNDVAEMNERLARELDRIAHVVGGERRLRERLSLTGTRGSWERSVEAVNSLTDALARPTREVARVIVAVAEGDLSQKMPLTIDGRPVLGDFLRIATAVNTMVDQLSAFAVEVSRVAREVGTDGKLGGQAEVRGVSGTWKDLTDNVNGMAANLTGQVRSIARVTAALSDGDLSQRITVEARGEVLELKETINTTIAQLSSFAAEVTRVAEEVGTAGKLGAQAEVEGLSGTWLQLTGYVNELAGNLTTQVRAIADVSTAVTRGDLTQSVTVEARGEVAELRDNINRMIDTLRETARTNAEQTWLKANLARISTMLQGQRDLGAVSRIVMSEVTPLVEARHGAFFIAEPAEDDAPVLRRIAGYGYAVRGDVPESFRFGEGLVGQTAIEKRKIVLSDPPNTYIRIASGLGEASPTTILVMPILFEQRVLGVIEIAAFQPLAPSRIALLDQLMETLGVVIHTIIATMRTEELLAQSQGLAQALQEQQEELKRSNAELEAQAKTLTHSELLLQRQQGELQQTNRDVEAARRALEEKAEQLALSSQYKSEFAANMSHELRTPLNSIMILAQLLADNGGGNLTAEQVDYARAIRASGSDLLSQISDLLDLSKVEAGRMDINPTVVSLDSLRDYVEATFRPVAAEKGLDFEIELRPTAPPTLVTDEQRLQQVLKNLLSNAFKFTASGGVALSVYRPHPGPNGNDEVVAFSVTDTGIGVAKDKLQVIFEPFQQADGGISRKYGGTGLGLSISREMARLLGGEISVESLPGNGPTFTLFLPLEYRSGESALEFDSDGEVLTGHRRGRENRATHPDTLHATAEPGRLTLVGDDGEATPSNTPTILAMPDDIKRLPVEGDAVDPVPEGTKVLVVDDDVRNVFALTSALESQGMEVVFAESGPEGIAQLEANPDVALVLMDVMMPGMDGYETTRAIRLLPAFERLPIISLSSKAMRGDRERSLASGASDYIAKPVDVVQLISMMRLWLSR